MSLVQSFFPGLSRCPFISWPSSKATWALLNPHLHPWDPLLFGAWRKHRPSANGPAFSASAFTTLCYLIDCGQNTGCGPSLVTPQLCVSFLNFHLGKPVSARSPLMVVVLILLHRQRTAHNEAKKGFSKINIFNNIWNIYSMESLSYVNLCG